MKGEVVVVKVAPGDHVEAGQVGHLNVFINSPNFSICRLQFYAKEIFVR